MMYVGNGPETERTLAKCRRTAFPLPNCAESDCAGDEQTDG